MFTDRHKKVFVAVMAITLAAMAHQAAKRLRI
jgi:hypothetical protein